jgi:hypothetical protein
MCARMPSILTGRAGKRPMPASADDVQRTAVEQELLPSNSD